MQTCRHFPNSTPGETEPAEPRQIAEEAAEQPPLEPSPRPCQGENRHPVHLGEKVLQSASNGIKLNQLGNVREENGITRNMLQKNPKDRINQALVWGEGVSSLATLQIPEEEDAPRSRPRAARLGLRSPWICDPN